MKKLFALVIVIVLTGCGNHSSNNSDNPSLNPSASQPVIESQTPAERAAYVINSLPSAPFFGVTTEGTGDIETILKVESETGSSVSVWQQFQLAKNPLNADKLNTEGRVPSISLETWDGDFKTGDSMPDWRNDVVTSGHYDAQLTKMAKTIAKHRGPVLLRFDHEMNGQWEPWADQANGNTVGSYATMWRHVHDVFVKAGATNAIWVWSPNILRGTTLAPPLTALYPGDAYVDLVGLTGYGVNEVDAGKTFDTTLAQLTFTHQPIILAEVGTQQGPNKAAWLRSFGPWLRAHPRVAGFIWFELVKRADWRFDDTPQDLAAFQETLRSIAQ